MLYIMGNTISRRVFQVAANRGISASDKHNGKTETAQCLDGRFRIHIDDYSLQECTELAFLRGSDFVNIFGKKNPEYGSKLTVVKITNPKTKKSIHRLYRTSSSIHGMNGYIGLSYPNLLALSSSSDSIKEMDELEITEGCRFLYYWNHPYSMTKVSTRIGLVGLVFSLVGLIISIVSLFL